MYILFYITIYERSFVSIAALFDPSQFVVLLLLVCGLTFSLTVIRRYVVEYANNAAAECSGSDQYGYYTEDESPNILLLLLFFFSSPLCLLCLLLILFRGDKTRY